MKIEVTPENAGMRLDKFLVSQVPGRTRSQLQKMIKNGLVTIAGQKVTVHRFLKTNDNIEVKTGLVEEKVDTHDLNVTYEDPSYLIVNKPIGLLMHPSDTQSKGTLTDMVIKKYPEVDHVGDDINAPGLVSRLDRDVSGLVVVARNQDAYEHLKAQFSKRLVDKIYIALVWGKVKNDQGIIDLPIGRGRQGTMAAHPQVRGAKLSESDRQALTEYKVLRRIGNFSLLEIKIKTGRTHQIRVHLKAIGHPIVGDPLYKVRRFANLFKRHHIDRPFLHSQTISFFDPKHVWQTYTSELPNELNNYLSSLDAKAK